MCKKRTQGPGEEQEWLLLLPRGTAVASSPCLTLSQIVELKMHLGLADPDS